MASCLVEFFSSEQHLKYRISSEALLLVLYIRGRRSQNSTIRLREGLNKKVDCQLRERAVFSRGEVRQCVNALESPAQGEIKLCLILHLRNHTWKFLRKIKLKQ